MLKPSTQKGECIDMETILKFSLYCLYAFAGLVCLGMVIIFMESSLMKKTIIPALYRVCHAFCSTIGAENVLTGFFEQIMFILFLLSLIYLLITAPDLFLATLF